MVGGLAVEAVVAVVVVVVVSCMVYIISQLILLHLLLYTG
jgi:hypothetical protein